MNTKFKKIQSFCIVICCILTSFFCVYADGEVTAKVSLFDSATKKIVITVSENIDGGVGAVSIFNTESYETVSATAAVESGNTIIVSYSKALSCDTEYAVVFENDVFGVSGNKINSKYVYFTTDGSYEPADCVLYDFDTKEIGKGGPVPATYYETVDAGETRGKAMKVTASLTNGDQDMNFSGVNYYNSDRWGLSFDVKVTKEPVSFALLLFSPNSGTPCGLGFTTSKRIMFCANSWLDKATLSTDIDRWFSDFIIGDAEIGSWVNYKIVYNKIANVFSIYTDDKLVKNVESTYRFDNINNIRLSLRNQNNLPTVGEEMIWLDNIRFEKYNTASKVEKVRFCDLNGNTMAAPQNIKRDIDKIKIDFLSPVDKETLTKDTLQLKYGDNAVEYTVESTDSETSYIIKPKNLPSNGEKVSVSLSGAKGKNGNILSDYSTYVTVNDNETDFKVSKLELVNSTGESADMAKDSDIYLKTTLINKTDKDETKMLFITGYDKDNSLKVFACKKVTVLANSSLIIDSAQNSIKISCNEEISHIVGMIDSVDGKILRPLTDCVSLTTEKE